MDRTKDRARQKGYKLAQGSKGEDLDMRALTLEKKGVRLPKGKRGGEKSVYPRAAQSMIDT